jgi:ribosome maturation factor RimP
MRGSGISASDLEHRFRSELALHGYDLVEVEVLRGGGRLTLRFLIDKPGGVTVEDCAQMDRAISLLLEADEDKLNRYVVEVSSPGVFRRLRRPEHFQRYVGEWVKLTVLRGSSTDTRQRRGRLVAVDESGVTLELSPGETERIAFTAVKHARLDPELLIGRSRSGAAAKTKGPRKGK